MMVQGKGRILCSTGALIGRPNNRNYRLLKEFAPKLNCDGFEFMVYSSWYPEIDELIDNVKAMNLNIPVIHCQKSIGESLCGLKVIHEGDNYTDVYYTPEEDKEVFKKGIEEFKINLRVAKEFGAEKMVLHLWNGIPSDKNIDLNISRYQVLRDMANAEGLELLVENVVCNCHDPLSDVGRVHRAYPDAGFVYDTKMAEFHQQTLKVFDSEWEWMFKEGFVKHLHINDYSGGYMDWGNLKVLPIGSGHVDFEAFFEKVGQYGYSGDFTVESTGFNKEGIVDFDMLNQCFWDLKSLISRHLVK